MVINNKYLQYNENEYTDLWEALRDIIKPLVKDEYITENWLVELKKMTDRFGYYFVITEDMAFPHISPSENTLKDIISLTILKNPIVISNDNQEKVVKYILILVATTGDGHMASLQRIVNLWNDANWLKLIKEIKNQKEIIKIEKFQIKKFEKEDK